MDGEKWITRQEAADILGKSISAVRKYEAEKRIRSSKEADNSVVVSAEDVEKLAVELAGDPATATMQKQLDLVFKSRYAVVDDLRLVIQEQRAELGRKDTRITELEGRMQEVHTREAKLLRELEELESFRHDRELDREREQRAQGRRDEAIAMARPLAGALAMKLGLPKGAATALGGGPGNPVVKTLTDLRDSITEKQEGELANILTFDQQIALMALFDALPGGEKPELSGKGKNGG